MAGIYIFLKIQKKLKKMKTVASEEEMKRNEEQWNKEQMYFIIKPYSYSTKFYVIIKLFKKSHRSQPCGSKAHMT